MSKSKISEFYILAVDIETSGSSYQRNGILSIGISLQNNEGVEHESFQANILLTDERTYDKACKENFWNKFPAALKFVENNARHPKEVMKELSDFLLKIEVKYLNIIIVSDNPSFDIGWIDHYLDQYADRKPLRYSASDQYRMVWDSTSIQKSWLCLKTAESLFHSPPKDHRKKLGLLSSYDHDHNPLNDARTIASHYLQTLEQMKSFRDTLPKPLIARTIVIDEYNNSWDDWFTAEKNAIQKSFDKKGSKDLVEVLHVGSTSVKGLSAKPIIDIVLVVKDPYVIEDILTEAGYRYKGEYNIPMRKMYGKNIGYEVYLHAYEADNNEVQLNTMFRDFLRNNPHVMEEYSQLKKAIVEKDNTHTKLTSTGITTYNLQKNDFIQKVLDAAGFNALCMRLCTQDNEWASYNNLRQKNICKVLEQNHAINLKNPDQKHVVLYQGTKVVGAAQLELSAPNAFLAFLGVEDDKDASHSLIFKKYLIINIQKWLKKLNFIVLTTFVNEGNTDFYEENNFKIIENKNSVIYMLKLLNEPLDEYEVPRMDETHLKLSGNFLEDSFI